MTVAECRTHYDRHSKSASDRVRQLGFAGIAIIWVFRVGTDQPFVPATFYWPMSLIVAGLALDFGQYVFGSLLWGGLARLKELGHVDRERDAPRWINWPALVCFWGKLAAMSIAYIGIFGTTWQALFTVTG
jgi:hypothetical protein